MSELNTRSPLYAVGDQVKHIVTRVKGKIIGIVNEDNLADVQKQGFRYTIDANDGLWSVLEKNLKLVSTKSTT